MVFPLSIHWLMTDNTQPCRLQVVIVAPKKKLHHAVDRNRAKRLMRECYRMRKGRLLEYLERRDMSMVIGINYIHNEILDYHQLAYRFDKVFDTLINHLESTEKPSNQQEDGC